MAKKAKRLQSHESLNNDRISALPEQILHHILSFLPPNDVMMTTFLSRTWRDVWITLPSLNLNKSLFCQTLQHKPVPLFCLACPALPKDRKLRFLDFIDRTLIRKRSIMQSNTNTTLSLYIPLFSRELRTPELSIRLSRWFQLALNDLKVEGLIFHNGESGNKLRFKFVINESLDILPLKRLELGCVKIDTKMIEWLSRHCPKMERLCFYNCNQLGCFKVSGLPKLVEFVIRYDKIYSSKLELEVENTPNLRLLECNTNGCHSTVKADTCYDSLRDLKLCGSAILGSHGQFSLLLNLELKMCSLSKKNVVISGNNLKTLSLHDCIYSATVKVKIDAPSLKYFSFTGRLPQLFELNHSGLEKAKFQWNITYHHFEQLVAFLPKINPCEEIQLEDSYFPKKLIIRPEKRGNQNSPVPDLKHIKLRFPRKYWSVSTSEAGFSIGGVIDTLLWLFPCPLKMTISLSRPSDELEFKVLKFKYYEEGKKGAKRCNKCVSLPARCWQHHLEAVNIENHRADSTELAYNRRHKSRTEDDNDIKAFFENVREKEKITVNIIR